VRQLRDTLDHKKNIQHPLFKGPPGGVELLQKFLHCRIPPAIMEEKGRHRAYDATCAGDMIRFARNLLEHVPRLGTSAWATIGEQEMETEGVISQGAIEGRHRTARMRPVCTPQFSKLCCGTIAKFLKSKLCCGTIAKFFLRDSGGNLSSNLFRNEQGLGTLLNLRRTAVSDVGATAQL